MKIGYGCSWWRPVGTTWSGTSASLLSALAARDDADVVTIDAQRNLLTGTALSAIGRARGYGVWKYGAANRALTAARVRRAARRSDIRAMVAVGDVETVLDVPTLFYQDATFSVAAQHREVLADYVPALDRFPAGRLDQLVSEQQSAYQDAAFVLSFSHWFAKWLVEHDGIGANRVRVVGGGLHGVPSRRRIETRGETGTRVLFIGRDFRRKGGDSVITAIETLRNGGGGDFTLTVVGPAVWPMRGAVPDWVQFLGELPAPRVRELWRDHDIFAMPTWYEPYGLVFLEARAAGVPTVARDAFCMPELVPDTAGRRIPIDGASDEVATALHAVSNDPELFHSVASRADAVVRDYTWDAVAERVMLAVREAVAET